MFGLTTEGQYFVVALRLLVPLLILRKPLLGGVLAMLLDGADVMIVELFRQGGMGPRYHQLDKVLDLYYLGLEFVISLRWTERLDRTTSIVLFVYRMIGVALFELTGIRIMLFLFPNLFENWFLFCVARARFFSPYRLDTWGRVAVVLGLLYIPKLPQEYLLHYAEAMPWDWFKRNVLYR